MNDFHATRAQHEQRHQSSRTIRERRWIVIFQGRDFPECTLSAIRYGKIGRGCIYDINPYIRLTMFEMSPFCDCPLCGGVSTFGVLYIHGNRLTQRCQKCRHSENTALPVLDKKVIYLDQFAVSNAHKIRSGETLKPAHVHDFWTEFDRRITRAQMSQAAVFPPSDIHLDETIVSRFPSALRIAHEMFGGDVSFVDSETLNSSQEMAYAEAFIKGRPVPNPNYG